MPRAAAKPAPKPARKAPPPKGEVSPKATEGGSAQTPAPNAVRDPTPAEFAEVRHDRIHPDPWNPRRHFDPDGLAELAASIAADGVLEPLVVREVPDEPDAFLLIAGERRWRAIGQAIFAGAWPLDRRVPVMIRTVENESDARRLALLENLQRRDLGAVEEARALKALQELTGVSAAQIGRDLGFTERWAQQRLQLLSLPEPLQARIDRRELKLEEARTAAAIWDKLPPIKRTELERGVTSVAEAKAWLDNQPKPLDLTPRQWLMALEIVDAMKRAPMKKASYEFARTEVGYAARGDGQLEQLSRRGLFDRAAEQRDSQYEATGRLYVAQRYNLGHNLDLRFGEAWRPGGEALQALLADLRAEAGIEGEFPPGRYVTPWLNGPFEIPEEIAAKYAKVLAARKKAAAEEKARKAKAEADLEARKANAAENDRTVDAILAALPASPAPADPRFAAALAAAGAPAPWRIGEHGEVQAADGTEIMWRAYGSEASPWMLTRRRLLVAAVNLAAGVVAADPPPQGEVVPEGPEGGSAAELADPDEIPPYLRRLAGAAEAAAEEDA